MALIVPFSIVSSYCLPVRLSVMVRLFPLMMSISPQMATNVWSSKEESNAALDSNQIHPYPKGYCSGYSLNLSGPLQCASIRRSVQRFTAILDHSRRRTYEH